MRSVLLSILAVLCCPLFSYAGSIENHCFQHFPSKMFGLTPAQMVYDKVRIKRENVPVVYLLGKPGSDQVFVWRSKFPRNYVFKPHKHPMAMFDTVISGAIYFGPCGGKLRTYPAGSFIFIPTNYCHYGHVGTKGVMLQSTATGKWHVIEDL